MVLFIGKSSINGPFSMAMLIYQRVTKMRIDSDGPTVLVAKTLPREMLLVSVAFGMEPSFIRWIGIHITITHLYDIHIYIYSYQWVSIFSCHVPYLIAIFPYLLYISLQDAYSTDDADLCCMEYVKVDIYICLNVCICIYVYMVFMYMYICIYRCICIYMMIYVYM